MVVKKEACMVAARGERRVALQVGMKVTMRVVVKVATREYWKDMLEVVKKAELRVSLSAG
jgi:hypothetical protein